MTPNSTAGRRAMLVTASLAGTAAGCIGYVHTPPIDARAVPPRQFEADPAFASGGFAPVSVSETPRQTRHHDVVELGFDSIGGGRVDAVYLRSRSVGAHKLVVVLPVWGRSDYPPRRVARGYARHAHGQAHVIRLRGPEPLFPWDALSGTASEAEFIAQAEAAAARFRAAVVDLRRLLDWAERQPEIDAGRIGIVGFSMGALVTATLLGNDARLDAAVLMMGAAEYAEVFARCGNKAGEVREHAMRRFGWTLDDYRDFFAPLFAPADPARYRGRYDPGSLLLFDARFDDCMPAETRDRLWEVTGRPERIMLWSRHRSAFYSMTPLGLNYSRRRIFEFLDRKL